MVTGRRGTHVELNFIFVRNEFLTPCQRSFTNSSSMQKRRESALRPRLKQIAILNEEIVGDRRRRLGVVVNNDGKIESIGLASL